MFEKILIANRGEIALRASTRLPRHGLKTVVVHSEADSEAKYVKLADESVCIGPRLPARAISTYPHHQRGGGDRRRGDSPGATVSGRKPRLAERVDRASFIGPQAETIRLMDDKVNAKQVMGKAGCPCVPGSTVRCPIPGGSLKIARKSGISGIVKPRAGRRTRHAVSSTLKRLKSAISVTRGRPGRLSARNGLSGKYLENRDTSSAGCSPTGIQNVVHLGERDCSISDGTRRSWRKPRHPSLRRSSARVSASAVSRPAARSATAVRYFRILYEKASSTSSR